MIESSSRWAGIDLMPVWRNRELLFFLTWRLIKVRYKQAALGATWVVLQPLLTMAVFTLVFGRLAKMPSDGIPYPLFAFAALLPWTLFQQGFSRAATGLVAEAGLITKVYFPRILVLLAGVIMPLIDFLLGLLVLFGLMLWYGVTPTWHIIALPVFVILAMVTAVAGSLWLAPINVKYRDVAQALPFVVQIWMYASPVVYPASRVPEQWQTLYAINPMVGVIEGVRWSLLGTSGLDARMLLVNIISVALVTVGGLMSFRRAERTFADVV